MDANERSDTMRAGIDLNRLVLSQHVISSIINEHGITSTLILMMNHLMSCYHQNSPTLPSSNFALSPVSFKGIASDYHGEHNGMTHYVKPACGDAHIYNRLWPMLISIYMSPPQKQQPPNRQSFDIYIIKCIYIYIY